MALARQKRAEDIFKLGGKVYAFDSTTIPLCLSVFWWAKFRKKKGGVKAHVVRAKTNLQYRCVKWKRRMPKNILTDAEIELTVYNTHRDYSEKLRLIRYYDEEQDRVFMFLTNAMDLTALQIADLYKNRWQIELFFKWLKQHLKIKKFWGTTENAVRIQISAAITAYCLVAIVQHDMKLKRSTYEALQILSISLTDKTPLRELFEKIHSNDVKEQFGPLFPGLFD